MIDNGNNSQEEEIELEIHSESEVLDAVENNCGSGYIDNNIEPGSCALFSGLLFLSIFPCVV